MLAGGRIDMRRIVHEEKEKLIETFSGNFLWDYIFSWKLVSIKVSRETGLLQNVDALASDSLNLYIHLKAFVLSLCYFRIMMPDVSCPGCWQWNSSHIYLLIPILEALTECRMTGIKTNTQSNFLTENLITLLHIETLIKLNIIDSRQFSQFLLTISPTIIAYEINLKIYNYSPLGGLLTIFS